jgi:Pyruvate/2-oxoacid:ferredoxin oxidoreductase delta subunit
MKKRQIINIDKEKCNGCGNCVTGCQEGALQIVDGKAELVNEKFCDGFGACIGECPTGALTIEEREAKGFDLEAAKDRVTELRGEEAAEEMMAEQEKHQQEEQHGKHQSEGESDSGGHHHGHHGHGNHAGGGCPGAKMMNMKKAKKTKSSSSDVEVESQLEQWPIQINLLPPTAPYFQEADLLITADCVPAAYGNYHNDLLQGKAVAMGCPKLDDGAQYVDKLAAIIEANDLNSITVARMEVPCCGGLERIAKQAIQEANSDLEMKTVTIGVDGTKK